MQWKRKVILLRHKERPHWSWSSSSISVRVVCQVVGDEASWEHAEQCNRMEQIPSSTNNC